MADVPKLFGTDGVRGRANTDLSPDVAFSLARAAAVLMLLHTDRHYRWCAAQVGHQPWRGPNTLGSMLGTSLAAAVSPWWSRKVIKRVEHDLLEAARALGP